MDAYTHFNLNTTPFEGKPDPRFYYGLPIHAETLATLQYAVHTAKSCCLVLGESGSGKTLLARLLAESVNRRSRILWAHGIGQPAGATELTIYPPGTLCGTRTLGRIRPQQSTLAAWMRSAVPSTSSSVIIIDNADGLHRHNWEDVLSLVTREFRVTRTSTLILLGLPSLARRLATRSLVRVRRRVFRTCQLPGLTRAQAEAYIQHRLAVAGGRNKPFTPGALDLIHRVSGGNPALINQVCDNALIDAFGEGRLTVDVPHVSATVQAIVGPATKHWRLRPPPLKRLAAGDRADLTDEPYLPSRLSQLLSGAEPDQTRAPMTQPHSLDESDLTSEIPALEGGLLEPVSSGQDSHAVAARSSTDGGVAVAAEAKADAAGGATSALLVDRLRIVEVRISDALSRVREARTQHAAGPKPIEEVPATDVAK